MAKPDIPEIEDIENDEDVFHLGYTCLGKMTDLYPDLPDIILNNYYRVWIWENKQKHRVAIWDQGNTHATFFSGGTKQDILDYAEADDELQVEWVENIEIENR